VRRRGGVRRHPRPKRLRILDRDRLIGRRDDVEACADTPVRSAFALARVVCREHHEVSWPLGPHALQALPQARRPGITLATEVGPTNRLDEQEVTGERQRFVGDEREAPERGAGGGLPSVWPGTCAARSVARPKATVSPSVNRWYARRPSAPSYGDRASS